MGVDGADDPDLERLNHLGPLARNDLARGRGDDLDMPDGRPGHGEHEEQDDGAADGAPGGRGRRLDDLQGGREEFELIAAPTQPRGRQR